MSSKSSSKVLSRGEKAKALTGDDDDGGKGKSKAPEVHRSRTEKESNHSRHQQQQKSHHHLTNGHAKSSSSSQSLLKNKQSTSSARDRSRNSEQHRSPTKPSSNISNLIIKKTSSSTTKDNHYHFSSPPLTSALTNGKLSPKKIRSLLKIASPEQKVSKSLIKVEKRRRRRSSDSDFDLDDVHDNDDEDLVPKKKDKEKSSKHKSKEKTVILKGSSPSKKLTFSSLKEKSVSPTKQSLKSPLKSSSSKLKNKNHENSHHRHRLSSSSSSASVSPCKSIVKISKSGSQSKRQKSPEKLSKDKSSNRKREKSSSASPSKSSKRPHNNSVAKPDDDDEEDNSKIARKKKAFPSAIKGPKSAFFPRGYLSQLVPLEVNDDPPNPSNSTSPKQVFIPRSLQGKEKYVKETRDFHLKHAGKCSTSCDHVQVYDLLELQYALEKHVNGLEGKHFALSAERAAYREFCEKSEAKKRKKEEGDKSSRRKGKKDSVAWFLKHWSPPDRMAEITGNRREAPDERRGEHDTASGLELIGRLDDKHAYEAAMQLTVVSTAAYLANGEHTHHLTEQNASRMNRIKKQLVVVPAVAATNSASSSLSPPALPATNSTTKSNGKGGEKASENPSLVSNPTQQLYCSENNQKFEKLTSDFNRFYVHDLAEGKHVQPLEAYCRGQALFGAVLSRLLDGRLPSDFEELFEGDEEDEVEEGGDVLESVPLPCGSTTETSTGLRASARIRRNRSSSDESSSNNPYLSHNGCASPGSPSIAFARGKRSFPIAPPASPTTRQTNGGQKSSGFKIPRLNGNCGGVRGGPPTPTLATSRTSSMDNGGEKIVETDEPPSPTALLNDLFSFSGAMTRHQIKTLQETIDQNRLDFLNNSGSSKDGLKATLHASSKEYLKKALKGLRTHLGAKSSETPYKAADALLKESLEDSWTLLRLLNDHVTLFGPHCYGCLASEDVKTSTENSQLSPAKKRGRRSKVGMVNGHLSNNVEPGTSSTSPLKGTLSPLKRGAPETPPTPINSSFPFTRGRKRSYTDSMEANHLNNHNNIKRESSFEESVSEEEEEAASSDDDDDFSEALSSESKSSAQSSLGSRQNRNLPCPTLEDDLEVEKLVASWASASEVHTTSSNSRSSTKGGSGGGGSSSSSSSSRDNYYSHHHHHNNHYNHHHSNHLLEPEMLMDDNGIKELLGKVEKTGGVVKLNKTHFAKLPSELLQEEAEEGVLINKKQKFFPVSKEDVPYLRSHDPFGVIEQQQESTSKPEQNISNGNGNHYTSSRRRLSLESKMDSEESKEVFDEKEELDIEPTIRMLAEHLDSVSRSNGKTVSAVWSATQQELSLQELREKADNHHAVLCHEFTPYFSVKRKELEVPASTKNHILSTLSSLHENKCQADRVRREMGITEYIAQVFRLKQCSLGTPLPKNSDPSNLGPGSNGSC